MLELTDYALQSVNHCYRGNSLPWVLVNCYAVFLTLIFHRPQQPSKTNYQKKQCRVERVSLISVRCVLADYYIYCKNILLLLTIHGKNENLNLMQPQTPSACQDVLLNTFHAQELKGSPTVVLVAFPEVSPEMSAPSADVTLMSIPVTLTELQTNRKNSPGNIVGMLT